MKKVIQKKLMCFVAIATCCLIAPAFASEGIDFHERPTTVLHSDFTGDGKEDIYVYHKKITRLQLSGGITIVQPMQNEEGKLFYRAHDSSERIRISFDTDSQILNGWRNRTPTAEQHESFANPDLREGVVKTAFVDFFGRVHATQHQITHQQQSVTTGPDIVKGVFSELPGASTAFAVIDYFDDKHVRDTLATKDWAWASGYRDAYVNAMEDYKGITNVMGKNLGLDIPAAARSTTFQGVKENQKTLEDYMGKVEEFLLGMIDDAWNNRTSVSAYAPQRARELAMSYLGYDNYKTDEESNLANQQGRDISPTPQGCTGCGSNSGSSPDSNGTPEGWGHYGGHQDESSDPQNPNPADVYDGGWGGWADVAPENGDGGEESEGNFGGGSDHHGNF